MSQELTTKVFVIEFEGASTHLPSPFENPQYRIELRSYNNPEANAVKDNFMVKIFEFKKHKAFFKLSTRKMLYACLSREKEKFPFLVVFDDTVKFEDENLVFTNLLFFCCLKCKIPAGIHTTSFHE